MNPLNEKELAGARQEVAAVANALLQCTLPFLDGVRKLASARFKIPGTEHDTDLLLFAAIDSQADHIPPANARGFCSASWLDQCDREAEALASFYAQEVAAACQRLTARFGQS